MNTGIRQNIVGFAAGLLFGLGLLAAGMVNPAKILSFLDLFGAWDPSLAFTMGGAMGVTTLAFLWSRKHGKNLLKGEFHWPSAKNVDKRLIIGGLLFGVGWGLAGFCPGPAVVAVGAGIKEAFWFAGAMVIGMVAWDWVEKRV